MLHREVPQLLSESFWMAEEFSLIRIINWNLSRSFHPEITELLEMEGEGNALGISDINGKQPIWGCNIYIYFNITQGSNSLCFACTEEETFTVATCISPDEIWPIYLVVLILSSPWKKKKKKVYNEHSFCVWANKLSLDCLWRRFTRSCG